MTKPTDTPSGERFTGHGPEWQSAQLNAKDAQTATVWVEQIINKRSMQTGKERVEDVRDIPGIDLDDPLIGSGQHDAVGQIRE